MKKIMGLMLGLSLAVGAFSFAFAQDKKDTTKSSKAKNTKAKNTKAKTKDTTKK